MIGDIGDQFHRETKYYRGALPAGISGRTEPPAIYKEYPHSRKIRLSHPDEINDLLLMDILKIRKSIRNFSSRPLGRGELSYLLWASTGISRREQGYEFRTSPSAGALYPIETYLVVNNVTSIKEGIYHYSVKEHFLEELETGSFGEAAAHAVLEQEMCLNAAVVFIWTAVFCRSKWKYGQRAFRYIYLEAGHIAANLALAAVRLGLGSCQIGALFDDEVNKIVGVDGTEESVVYVSVVGHPLD